MQHSSTRGTRTLLCTHPGCMPGVDIVRAEAAMLDILRDKLEEIRTGQGKKQQDKALAALQKSVRAAEKNIQTLKKQQDKLYTLLEQEVYSLEVFKERNQVISQKLTAAQKANSPWRLLYMASSSAHSRYGNSATTSTKWLKNTLYTAKPDSAYRQAPSTA